MPPRDVLLKVFQKSDFSDLEETDIDEILPLCEFIQAKRGDCIRSPENPTSAMYLILSGAVTIFDVQHKRTLAQMEEGDSFGLLSMLFPGHVSSYAEASADTVLLMYDAISYRMMQVSNPKLAIALFRCIQSALTPVMTNAASVLTRICE